MHPRVVSALPESVVQDVLALISTVYILPVLPADAIIPLQPLSSHSPGPSSARIDRDHFTAPSPQDCVWSQSYLACKPFLIGLPENI